MKTPIYAAPAVKGLIMYYSHKEMVTSKDHHNTHIQLPSDPSKSSESEKWFSFTISLTTLKYFCINNGDQRVLSHHKCLSLGLYASFEYLCYGSMVIINIWSAGIDRFWCLKPASHCIDDKTSEGIQNIIGENVSSPIISISPPWIWKGVSATL